MLDKDRELWLKIKLIGLLAYGIIMGAVVIRSAGW
jgi:hypothetical protein